MKKETGFAATVQASLMLIFSACQSEQTSSSRLLRQFCRNGHTGIENNKPSGRTGIDIRFTPASSSVKRS
jgi:hypothetical protein